MKHFLYLNVFTDGLGGPCCGIAAVLYDSEGKEIDRLTGWVNPLHLNNPASRRTADGQIAPIYQAPASLYRRFVRFMEKHRCSIEVITTDGSQNAIVDFLTVLSGKRYCTVPLFTRRVLDAQSLRLTANLPLRIDLESLVGRRMNRSTTTLYNKAVVGAQSAFTAFQRSLELASAQ